MSGSNRYLHEVIKWLLVLLGLMFLPCMLGQVTQDPDPKPSSLELEVHVWVILQQDWDTNLEKYYTQEWWDFTFALTQVLKLIYDEMTGFYSVHVKGYYKGSVLVDYAVLFRLPIDTSNNITQLRIQYTKQVGTATAKSLLNSNNILMVNGTATTVTGSYVFNQDPGNSNRGGDFQLEAITFEDLCELPDYEPICGDGECFTQDYDGDYERKTLHCNCTGTNIISPSCPTKPPPYKQPSNINDPEVLYPVAILLPLALILIFIILFLCVLRRHRRGHDRFLVETKRRYKSVSGESDSASSTFSAPIRFYPNYGRRWRTMHAGVTDEASHDQIPAGSIDTLHRQNFGREWAFDNDLDDNQGSTINGITYFDDEDEDDGTASSVDADNYVRHYYRHNPTEQIPRPLVSQTAWFPFRMPQMRRGPRLRDSSSVFSMTGTTQSSESA